MRDCLKINYSAHVHLNEGTCHQQNSVAHCCVCNHFSELCGTGKDVRKDFV